jgi:choline dehydrogenase-like flavoprotein
VLWAEAAKEMGYNPFPQPSGNLSQAYTNPLGVTLGPCTFCGFCERFGCGNYSKASPQITLLPVLMRRSNFEARTECEVTRINLDNTRKRATGVTYVDSQGRGWEQPAEMVFLCAFQMFNVQLLLLSGIGQPYDPTTGQGVIGRNFSYQVTSSVESFFDNKIFNTFIASGSSGCASTSSMATISITGHMDSSAAAISEWCKQMPGRSRQPRRRRALRNGVQPGKKRSRTITSARSCRRRTAAATAIATATSISTRPTRIGLAGR